jgi:transketolase
LADFLIVESPMKIATRAAFGDALAKVGEIQKNIVVLDADLSGSTKTSVFAKQFPDRFYNMGISEQDLIGTAAGLAIAGKNAFAASFAMFVTGRTYDQIRNTVAYSRLNVKIVGSHSGILTGEDGATHQMLEDISLMRGLEGMLVLQPADAEETHQMVKFLSTYEGPAYLRLGRGGIIPMYNEDCHFELGKMSVLREGEKACIIATGATVQEALIASEKLREQGVSVQVVNASSLAPFDTEKTKEIASAFSHIFSVEDHSIKGGLGSCIAEVMAENSSKAKLVRIGMKGFGESGTAEDLYKKYGIDSEGIYIRVLKELS